MLHEAWPWYASVLYLPMCFMKAYFYLKYVFTQIRGSTSNYPYKTIMVKKIPTRPLSMINNSKPFFHERPFSQRCLYLYVLIQTVPLVRWIQYILMVQYGRQTGTHWSEMWPLKPPILPAYHYSIRLNISLPLDKGSERHRLDRPRSRPLTQP